MAVTHSTVATSVDEAGAEVNKTEWNDDHVVDDGSFTIAKTTGLQTALDAKATVTALNLKAPLISPALVTPNIGTPSAGTLTNCTGLPLAGITVAAKTESIIVAAGDETTAIDVATGKTEFQMPYAFTLTEVRATVTTAPTTSGTLTVDINEGGTSILSTKLTIDVTEKTSTSAATAPVISDSTLADGGIITVDVDAISGGATEAGLKIYLIGYQT